MTHPHPEKHFTASAMVRDLVIGMSDGLTVPFALAAGLSGDEKLVAGKWYKYFSLPHADQRVWPIS